MIILKTKKFNVPGNDTCTFDMQKKPSPIITANGGLNGSGTGQHNLFMSKPIKELIMNKPEYHVPLMSEIKNIKWNGKKVISFFAGCGGSSTGYKMAGYKVVWANEFVKEAYECYKANAPDTIMDTRDIRLIQPSEILKAINLKKGELDIMDGSPPCQSFSTAGKREKGWGTEIHHADGSKQISDDLFFEYCRILKGIQPKIFVAENVSGLIKGTAKGYFLIILKALKECGYNVKCQLLDAQWLGVPQQRQRVIFIGTRNDLKIEPVFPKPFKYFYTVYEAMMGKPHIIGWKNEEFGVVAGNDTSDIVTDGTFTRKFTIAELKRICAFPDDFILTGSYNQQWARLGNSVPPLMMKQISTELLKIL